MDKHTCWFGVYGQFRAACCFWSSYNSAGVGDGRRSKFRLAISGLSNGASWQDLKDFMRAAGDVNYVDVSHDGTGVVEYSRREDMENALDTLHDTNFQGQPVSLREEVTKGPRPFPPLH